MIQGTERLRTRGGAAGRQARYKRSPGGVQVEPQPEPWCDDSAQGGGLRKRSKTGAASWRTGVQIEQNGEGRIKYY